MEEKVHKKLRQLRITVTIYMLINFIVCLIIGMSLEGKSIQNLNIFEWIIMILPFIFLSFALYNKLRKFPYICDKCSEEIYIKLYHMFTFKGVKSISIKCPHCKESVWAEIKVD